MQKESTSVVILKRELDNERKELLVIRDQNNKLLEQLQDGANRELLLKQKSSALNTSITNLHKDLRDVNSSIYLFRNTFKYNLLIFLGSEKS